MPLCLVLSGAAIAHVQMLNPMPRNTADRVLPQWEGGKFGNNTCERTPPQNTCWGGDCHNATQPCEVGQNFLWFNQGCSIGCAECDGEPSNPNLRASHPQIINKNGATSSHLDSKCAFAIFIGPQWGGGKTRLDSRRTRFNPHFIYDRCFRTAAAAA